MAVKLNERAFDHANSLIWTGKYVIDGRDAWSECWKRLGKQRKGASE
jgi:hypothetical protein